MSHSQSRFSLRNSLLLVIFTCIILGTAMAVSGCCGITGCNLFNTKFIYTNTYMVTVTGLGNHTGNDGFRILVPVPVLNGNPAYTGDQVRAATMIFPPPVSVFADYQTVYESRLVNNTGWTASLVNTEHGQMIEFSSGNASLSDLMYTIYNSKEVQSSERATYTRSSDPTVSRPLYPVSSQPSGNYSVPVSNSFGNYSSYIFIASGMDSGPGVPSGNISVIIYNSEFIAEGSVPTFGPRCLINESIPADVTGWIPVTVWKTEVLES